MEIPLQVTFRGFEHTAEIDAYVRTQADELETLAGGRMSSCHVVLELAQHHQHSTRAFHAKIDLTLPGTTIAANRPWHDHQPHQDPYAALGAAFAAASRQVSDWESAHRPRD